MAFYPLGRSTSGPRSQQHKAFFARAEILYPPVATLIGLSLTPWLQPGVWHTKKLTNRFSGLPFARKAFVELFNEPVEMPDELTLPHFAEVTISAGEL